MDTLSKRNNLVPFFLFLLIGISISLYLPQHFVTANIEVPAFALISVEIAIALIASVLAFENVSTSGLIRLTFLILVVAFLDAIFCYLVGHGSNITILPEATLKLNWLQLLAFNLTGICTITAIFTSVPSSVRQSVSPKTTNTHKDQVVASTFTEPNFQSLDNNISSQQTDFSINPPQNTTEKVSSPGTGGKPLQDVSGDIDDIFSQIAPQEKQIPSSPGDQSPTTLKEESPLLSPQGLVIGPRINSQSSISIKEFGKLATGTSVASEPSSAGTLKSIGQMLIDTKAVENIIRTQQEDAIPRKGTKWQVITLDKAANLQALMDTLSGLPGVESALLIGKDGMLLANTENLSTQKYVLGPLSLVIHNATNMSTSKLQVGQLQQAILRCGDKASIVTDVGIGILAVFSTWDTSKIDELVEGINKAALQDMSAKSKEPSTEKANTIATLSLSEVKAKIAAENTTVEPAKGSLDTDIFDKITSSDTPPPPAPVANIELKPAAAKSLNVSDSQVADLFDDLLAEDSKDKVAPANPSPKEAAKGPTELKEFGKLSASAASKQGSDQGAMKTIGRQLIDVQAVENIIKTGETSQRFTTAKVISQAHGEGINALLKQIDTCKGVSGSIVVGYDGFVLSSTLQQIDKEMVGAMCTGMYSHLGVATKKLDKGKLEQAIFFSTDNKITVFTSMAIGMLAVFVDQANLDQLNTLIQTIQTTARS